MNPEQTVPKILKKVYQMDQQTVQLNLYYLNTHAHNLNDFGENIYKLNVEFCVSNIKTILASSKDATYIYHLHTHYSFA